MTNSRCQPTTPSDPEPVCPTQIVLPAVLSAILWGILTGGDPGSWAVGVPAVVIATAVAVWLRSPCGKRLYLPGLVRFVPYFLRHSLAGGIDVAWRAVHPALPLTPATRDYPLRLPPDGPSRVVFIAVLGLSPGSFGADLRGDSLTIHVLDARPSTWESIRGLERRVADLFGLDLAATDPPGTTRL